MAFSTNDLKNGMSLNLPEGLFSVVEFQHVKPGKGGAFVRTKLRRASDGAAIDRTFRAGEKFRAVHTAARRMQSLCLNRLRRSLRQTTRESSGVFKR